MSTNIYLYFFFSSRRRHTRLTCDWSSDVCSSDLFLEGKLQYCGDLHRRGEAPAQIAAILELPLQEVELLIKVHRIVLRRSEERRVGKECRARRAPAR